MKVQLHRIAHARAGDKGNRVNIGLFPYDPAHYAALAEQVTEAVVLALFRHRGATRARRYDLPNLCGFNFVIDDALEGGVNGALNQDGHGKTHSFRLLAIEVDIADRSAGPGAGLSTGPVHSSPDVPPAAAPGPTGTAGRLP